MVDCGGTSKALAAVPPESIMTASSGEDTEEGGAELAEPANRTDEALVDVLDVLGQQRRP